MNKYNYGKQPNDKTQTYLKGYKNPNTFISIYQKNFIRECQLALLLLFSIITLGVVYFYFNPQPTIKDGHIQRSYSQLLRFLDENPADISSKRYEATIPSIVQKDIEKMLASNGELDIVYHSSDSYYPYIEITQDSQSSSGIRFTVYDSPLIYDTLGDNISLYKSEKDIILYGSSSFSTRMLSAFRINDKSFHLMSLENMYLDLYGSNISYDDVRYFDSNLSFIRNGNDFMFYKLGEQIGETYHFPGGKITEFNYSYILDDKHDMYYLYYCTHPDNPWVEFSKVDSNISRVESEYPFRNFIQTSMNTTSSISYPIYLKDGKRYVGVSHADTEKAAGQNYGTHSTLLDKNSLNFNIDRIPLSINNLSNVTFHREEKDFISKESDWYIHYNYLVNGQTIYYEERINGLDSHLSDTIPEVKWSKFVEKAVPFDQVDDVVNELKQLYEEYSWKEPYDGWN